MRTKYDFQDAMSSSKYMVIIHGYTIVILKVFEGAMSSTRSLFIDTRLWYWRFWFWAFLS